MSINTILSPLPKLSEYKRPRYYFTSIPISDLELFILHMWELCTLNISENLIQIFISMIQEKKNNLSVISHSISLYSASFIYVSLHIYNVLPDNLKEGPLLRFKHTIKNILQRYWFYSNKGFFFTFFNVMKTFSRTI